jgi:hypothetical protein
MSNGDRYLIIADVNEPRRPGFPSGPEIGDAVRDTLRSLYAKNKERALVNVRIFRVEFEFGSEELP